jgi:putative CocE/NonD family hydrolase
MRVMLYILILLMVAVAATVVNLRYFRAAREVMIEPNVTMKTRDGVVLNADIYRPKGGGKYPVILRRTPYGKAPAAPEGLATAARGYIYIAQDVRGRETSAGEWYPFKHEAEDGYDAVEWAAALPYSTGKVGMISGSYEGITQMYAAMAAPPHLVTIYPGVTPSDIYGQLVYNDGAFMLALAQAWSGALSVGEFARRLAPAANPDYWAQTHPLSEFPLVNIPDKTGVGRYYLDWMKHPTYDNYWKELSFERNYGKIKVPALHYTAWYDVFQVGSLRNYLGLKERAGSEAARKGQRLIIVPGGHAGAGPKIADVDFGPDSVFKSWEYGLRWFDWHLKGKDDGISKEKPVKLFIMGENVFRDEDDWPLARAVATRYYLHSNGRANSVKGDGRLSPEAPLQEAADRFIYDPAHPVPTLGGATLGIISPPPGPVEQGPLAEREDILVYTTPAFERPTEVTGPLSLEAYVSSSAEDTDLVGRLIDVAPDGKAILLTEGILRLRYRNSFEKPELMEPGRIYRVTVDLWATANVFKAGHKLRLEVTSSSFPRFDRHSNQGGDLNGVTTPTKATNVIHHDREHPSALIVPVVPR